MSFESHRSLSDEMLDAAQRPLPSTGFGAITMEQLSAYDVEVWRRLSERSRTGIRTRADGVRPLDQLMADVLVEPRVAMLLLPHQTHGGGRAASTEEPPLKKPKTDQALAQLRTELQNMRKKLAAGNGGGGGGGGGFGGGKGNFEKGKGKAAGKKGKGDGKGPRVPAALQGMSGTDDRNQRICYGFNLKSCTAAQPGAACDRGLHVCGKCFRADHAYIDCTA
jgi:hypothetical protein